MKNAEQNVDSLIERLPKGYEQACFDQKAIIRKREVKEPKSLIRLVLIYLVGGYSLIEMSVIAVELGIGKLSDTAFMNKFAKCKGWLEWIISQIIPNPIIEYTKPQNLDDYTIAAVDASDVSEKGRSGQAFKLHYMIDIFSMCAVAFKLTDRKTGESLLNFDVKQIGKKLLIIADRAYGTLKSITHCMDNQADFILRLRHKAFDLYDANGTKLDLLSKIADVTCETAVSIEVYAHVFTKKLTRLRVCAIKIPNDKLAQVERKGYRKGKGYKKRTKTSDEAAQLRKFVVVVTSLPESISADEIVKLYGLRWQIELYFKRLKSIMDFGNVPLKRSDSIMAWLSGKVLISLLIEQMLSEVSFSPCGEIQSQYMA